LQVGDIISEINNIPTSQLSLSEARHYFEQTSPLKLTFERNGSTKTIHISMKPKI
jgi:C-terminal processing protease CtpA/Prc